MSSPRDRAPVRVNYQYGQLLTAEDLEAEQDYHIGKARLRNRYLVGCGVVGGLEVDRRGHVLTVEPGLAIDCCGREVLVPDAQEMELPEAEQAAFLCLRYREYETTPAPIPDPGPGGGVVTSTRTVESYELRWEAQNPVQGHRCFKVGWAACGADHSVPLVRLVIRRGRASIRRVRCGRRGGTSLPGFG